MLTLEEERTAIVGKALSVTAKKYKNDYERLKAIEELKKEYDEAIEKRKPVKIQFETNFTP